MVSSCHPGKNLCSACSLPIRLSRIEGYGVYLNRVERQRKLTLEETYIPLVVFVCVLNFVDALFCGKL